MNLRGVMLSFAAFGVIAACSSSESGTPAPASDGGADASTSDVSSGGDAAADVANDVDLTSGPIGGARPVALHVPDSYAQGTPAPLLVLLHGYGASGDVENVYLHLTPQSDARGFLYVYPDGLTDSHGKQFWNATDACCDGDHTNVDDSAYLDLIVRQIKARYTVDPKRVFFAGHSNGAFMSYRMACDHADEIAAIVSIAGSMFADVKKCTPSSPVSVLEVHGTADDTVLYAGSDIGGKPYPGVTTTVSDWVTLDGCTAAADTTAPPLDLDTLIDGPETTITKYAGCKPGGHAELWSIAGGPHIPSFTDAFAKDLVDFLYAHPKP